MLSDLMAIELPVLIQWPLNASASDFLYIYDWDQLLVDSSSKGSNILDRRIQFCVGPYPCSLIMTGENAGELMRIGDGSLACLETNRCISITIMSLLVRCDSSISNNGVLEIYGAELTLLNTSFLNCSSRKDGGVMYIYGSASIVTVLSSRFVQTHSLGSGGAISMVGGSLQVWDSEFTGCSAARNGGCISAALFECYSLSYLVATVMQISDSRFAECSSFGNGGAVSASSIAVNVSINSSLFERCYTDGGGGGIAATDGAVVSVSGSTFRGNSAYGYGGGGLYAAESQLVISSLSCDGNTAPSGGGAALYWQGDTEPVFAFDAVANSSSSKRALSISSNSMCGPSNTARYGPCIASSSKKLQVTSSPDSSQPAYAGLPFPVLVEVWDAYNQTVTSESTSGIKVVTSLNGELNPDPSVSLQGGVLSIVDSGIARFLISVKPSFITNLSTLLIQGKPSIYFVSIDSRTLGSMQSEVIRIELGSSVCPNGHVLTLDQESAWGTSRARSGSCVLCKSGTYSVNPLAGTTPQTPSCLNCPAGGLCVEGSSVVFALGTWKVISSMYRLISCPPGYQLLNSIANVFSHDVQQCLACNKDQYIVDSTNSLFNCQVCPVGAICNGSTLQGIIPGSVWEADMKSGYYILKSCPPGYYELIDTSYDHQECLVCPATYFCTGGTAGTQPCPDGTFTPAGANSSSMCSIAIFVIVQIQLHTTLSSFAKDFEGRFVAALAGSCGAQPTKILVWSIQSTGRASAQLAAGEVMVTAKIASDSVSSAKAIQGRIENDPLNALFAQLSLPSGQILSVSITAPTTYSSWLTSSDLVAIGVSAAVLILIAVVVWYCMYGGLESKEEIAMNIKIAEVRAALQITLRHGFVLSCDKVPFWRQRYQYVQIPRSHVEAAARLAMGKDYDVGEFDAFCVLLRHGRSLVDRNMSGHGAAIRMSFSSQRGESVSQQWIALNEWLLDISSELVRPKISEETLLENSFRQNISKSIVDISEKEDFNFFRLRTHSLLIPLRAGFILSV